MSGPDTCPSCGSSTEQGCYADCPTTVITALRAENERLNKSRNKWGQKYNKLLEKHKVTLSQLKTAVWSDSEECKLLNAENERLRAALREYECHCPTSVCEWFPCGKTARNALEKKP